MKQKIILMHLKNCVYDFLFHSFFLSIMMLERCPEKRVEARPPKKKSLFREIWGVGGSLRSQNILIMVHGVDQGRTCHVVTRNYSLWKFEQMGPD
jgi:hypothetical protein